MSTIVLAFILILLSLMIIFIRKKYSYWSSRGVLTPSYVPILGHHLELLSSSRWLNIEKMYKDYKSQGYWGLYEGLKPCLYISDPNVVYNVLVKDAMYFTNRRDMKFSGKDKCFNEMLTVVKGEKWKSLRSLINPIFSNSNLEKVFPDIMETADQMVHECSIEMSKNKFVEISSILHYYIMDATAKCTLGIQTNCLVIKESSNFIRSVSYLSAFSLEKFIKFIFMIMSPKVFNALGFQFTSRDGHIFIDEIEKTVRKREISSCKRGDLLDKLLETMKKNDKKHDKDFAITHDTVVSEIVLYLIAGFETSASAISFLVFLLAKNPEAQSKVRKELQDAIKNDGKLTFKNVTEAKYLDACLSETLRLYPPNHFTERTCTKYYKITEFGLEVPEDMLVGIPIWSLHHDPAYWVNPQDFKPERFLPENRKNIKEGSYLPFGLGPRNCAGMKFALTETKLAMAKLCLNFELQQRNGFEHVTLDKTVSTLRPNTDGVPVVLRKLL